MSHFEITKYVTPDGRIPFDEWMAGLEPKAYARVELQIVRLEAGSLGDYKSVGGGVTELRLHFSDVPYRIYCARLSGKLIILLCGGGKGSKSSQNRDIQEAKAYLAECRERGES